MTFYRKLFQNPTMESCIPNTFCSTTYKLHNRVYILYTTGHGSLVKLFRLEDPLTFSSHGILMKFGQNVANQILHLTISTTLCYRIFADIIGNPKKKPRRGHFWTWLCTETKTFSDLIASQRTWLWWKAYAPLTCRKERNKGTGA